jgi:hypothetical protein
MGMCVVALNFTQYEYFLPSYMPEGYRVVGTKPRSDIFGYADFLLEGPLFPAYIPGVELTRYWLATYSCEAILDTKTGVVRSPISLMEGDMYSGEAVSIILKWTISVPAGVWDKLCVRKSSSLPIASE